MRRGLAGGKPGAKAHADRSGITRRKDALAALRVGRGESEQTVQFFHCAFPERLRAAEPPRH
eukprot:8360726-Lingulodinium_polyedra.AAC.1